MRCTNFSWIIWSDHLILARRPDLIIVNEKDNLPSCEIYCPGRPQRKIEKKKQKKKKTKRKISTAILPGKWKKLWNMKVTVMPIVIGALVTDTKALAQGLENLEKKRTRRDNPNNSFIKIAHDTKKSPGYLRRLAVTQTPVRNHRVRLVWKAQKSIIIIIIKIMHIEVKKRNKWSGT